MIGTKQLHYFAAVARLGSFSRAARHLRIAQPALSRQVRKLENDLGIRLLSRNVAGVTLTGPGRILFRQAKRILDELASVEREVARCSAASVAEVTLGLPQSAARVLATRLIQMCKRNRPRIVLRILEGWSGFIEDWLCAGQIDLGLVYDDAITSALVLEPLVLEDLFVIKRATGTGALKAAIPIADLAEIPIVVPCRQHGLRQVIERALAEQGRAPRVAIEAEALTVVKGLVEVEGWDAILPRAEAQTEIAAGKLVAVPIAPPGLQRRLCVARADRGALAPATRAIRDLVVAETRRVVGAGEWAAVLCTEAPAQRR